MRRRVHPFVLCLGLLAAAPAAADPMSDARVAMAAGDFPAAREALSDPSLRRAPKALMLRAGLMRVGLGGPVDPVMAYALYSRVVQVAKASEGWEAIDARVALSHQMTLEEIKQAEARVIALVDEDIGQDARRAEIASLKRDLQTLPAWGLPLFGRDPSGVRHRPCRRRSDPADRASDDT